MTLFNRQILLSLNSSKLTLSLLHDDVTFISFHWNFIRVQSLQINAFLACLMKI